MIFSIFFIEKHMRFIHNVQTAGMFFHVPVCSGIPYSPWYLPAVQNQVNGFLFILGCFTTILSVTVCHKKIGGVFSFTCISAVLLPDLLIHTAQLSNL